MTFLEHVLEKLRPKQKLLELELEEPVCEQTENSICPSETDSDSAVNIGEKYVV